MSPFQLAPRACLQLKKGKDGKMVMAKAGAPDYKDMQRFLTQCMARIDDWRAPAGQNPSDKFPIPHNFFPIWSLDNAPVHAKAYNDLTWKNKPAGDFGHAQPPPYSPDLHKVIEHVHGTVCVKFREELDKMTHPLPTIKEYFRKIQLIFYTSITAQSVQEDVRSLFGAEGTMMQIVGAKGGYPAAKYR